MFNQKSIKHYNINSDLNLLRIFHDQSLEYYYTEERRSTELYYCY